MLRFAGFLVVVLVINGALLRRPVAATAVGIGFLLAVPSFDAGTLTGVPYDGSRGGLPAVTAATWYFLIALALRLTTGAEVGRGLVRMVPWWLVAFLVFALQDVAVHRGRGLSQVLDVFLGPIAAGCVVTIEAQRTKGYAAKVRRIVMWAGALESVVAVLEFGAGRALFFQHQFATAGLDKFYADQAFRSFGTLDNALDLALFLLLALGCASTVTRTGRRLALQALMLGGIAASGSRVGLALGLVVIVLQGTGAATTGGRGALRALTGVGLGAVILQTTIGSLVSSRIQNDSGSADVRLVALKGFFAVRHEFYVSGNGVGSSFALSQSITGKTVSFENPFVMTAVDLGMVAAGLLLVGLLVLVARATRGGLRATALCVLVMTLSFSSFGAKTEAGFLLFLALALALMPVSSEEGSTGTAAQSEPQSLPARTPGPRSAPPPRSGPVPARLR